jgi:hypothetical protein
MHTTELQLELFLCANLGGELAEATTEQSSIAQRLPKHRARNFSVRDSWNTLSEEHRTAKF